MKKIKIFSLLFATILILLTACSGETRVNPGSLKLNKAYEFTANIASGEFIISAEFSRSDANVWNIALLEPAALEGVTIAYDKGIVAANFDGVDLKSEGKSQSDAVYKIIIDAFENAIAGEGREAVSSAAQIRITGKADDFSYEALFDKKTLVPLSLNIPDASISVEFSETTASNIADVVIVF